MDERINFPVEWKIEAWLASNYELKMKLISLETGVLAKGRVLTNFKFSKYFYADFGSEKNQKQTLMHGCTYSSSFVLRGQPRNMNSYSCQRLHPGDL